jgi:hypothetical protein
VAFATYVGGISALKILVIIPEGREYLEDLASDGRIMSKRTLEKVVMRVQIGFMWHRMWSSGRHL